MLHNIPGRLVGAASRLARRQRKTIHVILKPRIFRFDRGLVYRRHPSRPACSGCITNQIDAPPLSAQTESGRKKTPVLVLGCRGSVWQAPFQRYDRITSCPAVQAGRQAGMQAGRHPSHPAWLREQHPRPHGQPTGPRDVPTGTIWCHKLTKDLHLKQLVSDRLLNLGENLFDFDSLQDYIRIVSIEVEMCPSDMNH
ncbi:hypothetical protein PABG_11524 [Paracoccidioides brasiliensis Pb03]|nr:hypothetical protein PABG_11524 [Paracoccidioides brasiliensis Pb03]